MLRGWRAKRAGLTAEQVRALDETLPGRDQFDTEAPPPVPHWALPAWLSWGPWSDCGPTSSLSHSVGMSVSVQLHDHRPALYPARVAWLDEQGYERRDDRQALMALWHELDLEQLAIDSERVAEMLKTAGKGS